MIGGGVCAREDAADSSLMGVWKPLGEAGLCGVWYPRSETSESPRTNGTLSDSPRCVSSSSSSDCAEQTQIFSDGGACDLVRMYLMYTTEMLMDS